MTFRDPLSATLQQDTIFTDERISRKIDNLLKLKRNTLRKSSSKDIAISMTYAQNGNRCILVPYSSFPVIKNKKLFEV